MSIATIKACPKSSRFSPMLSTRILLQLDFVTFKFCEGHVVGLYQGLYLFYSNVVFSLFPFNVLLIKLRFNFIKLSLSHLIFLFACCFISLNILRLSNY